MEILILILIVFIFIWSITLNIAWYLIIKELREQLNLTNNSIKLWLDEEVDKKRTFSKLSEALEKDRDAQRNLLYASYKKYNRLKKYLKSFIKWRITLDILITKIK